MSAGVHARAGADVSFRDVAIKIPDRRCYQGYEWRHASESWAEIFEKCQLVESCRPKKKGDFHLLTEALWRVQHVLEGADGKVIIVRWYLSPYVEKPLNSKVIKSFVPELRSRKCFSCFGIPMLYICALWILWTFYVPVYTCQFHVFISGYVTTLLHSDSD